MTIKFTDDIEQQDQPTVELLKNISKQDFLGLGVHDIAYIRPVVVDGNKRFSIHAADGTPLSVMDSWEIAYGTILQNDLLAATVH